MPDFNYTVSLGFAAVPNAVDHPGVDTGERYDTAPWSDGPYVIDYFKAGIGGSLILKRNPTGILRPTITAVPIRMSGTSSSVSIPRSWTSA